MPSASPTTAAPDRVDFDRLVEQHYASMKRIARTFVGSDAVAEEVVQDTWLAIVAGIDRFEGRSSLQTWMFSILTNKAKTRGVRERRPLPVR
jgi:RNA polymerase sigma-70 factor (ECF subfamily)